MRRVLMLCSMLIFLTVSAFSQNRTITGTVTDEEGNPLENVSVIVKGTASGTVTTGGGTYSLSVSNNAKTLVFSFIGRETLEAAIGSSSVINMMLPLAASELSEVVVNVPYGTIKKTAFTGSEATITASSLNKQPVSNITKALDGLVAGVTTTNGGGAPGSGSALLIRGVGSVNATSSPLYVLDQVPYDGSITSLNPNDIESITILKDASAAALYGSRAANGVVMITTKKGQRGAPVTTVNVQQGFMSRGIPEYDRVGPQQYYELFWEAYKNNYIAQGNSPATAGTLASNVLTGPNGLVYNAYNVPGTELVDPATGKLNPNAKLLWNESWEDALYRTARRTNAFVSVAGAQERTNYYMSAGILDDEGIVRFSGYNRYDLRANINMKATDWLNTGLNIDGAVSKNKSVPSGGTATTNPFYYTRQMGPIYPVYQHDLTTGAFVIDPATGKPALDWGTPEQMGTRPYAGRSNLLGSLDLDNRSSQIFNGNANTFAEVTFLKDFSFKTTLGLNFYTSDGITYQNNQYGDAAPTPGLADGGRSTISNQRQLSLTANEVLTWNKTIGKHDIRALVGHENYMFKYHYLAGYMSGFLFPGQWELNNGTTSFSPPTSYENNHRIESYFGSANYTLNDKYLVSASYRTDGSSRFAPDVRWGSFYSAGLGWRLSQEDFLKNVSWINELKLKASYGEQGNEDIGLYYQYKAYYYAQGNGTYNTPSRPANPDLLWEKNAILNVGADFSLFSRRLQGSIEWYNRISDNLLFDVPLPSSTGNLSVYQNIGTMKNTGIEVTLSGDIVRKKDFTWRADFNITHYKNRITKLPDLQRETGIVTGTKKLFEGKSIYEFWLREYAGVDAATGDALYYKDVKDANGKPTGERIVTNQINQADYYFHGTAIPDFAGGLTNSFSYKGINLSFLLVYAYGGQFYDGNYASLMHRGSAGTAWSVDILDRWQKPGDVTNVPRLQNAISGQDGASTRWLFDASYLNIKNVSLGYTFPSNIANKVSMSQLDVFVNADNLWLFTAHKGMDPQRAFTGTADWSYTPYRTITFGITAKLK